MGRVWLPVAFALTAVLLARAAAATEFISDCRLMSAEQADELDARLKLLLHVATGTPPQRIEVRCFGKDVRVTVVSERIRHERVDTKAGLVEGVLDAVERVLTRRPTPAGEDAEVQTREPSEVQTREPSEGTTELAADEESPPPDVGTKENTPDDSEPPAERRDAGGIGLGLTTEYAFAPIGTLIGPHLDLAVGSGPYAASLTETLKFSSARGRRVLDFDVMAGFGFGAPYVATHDFGAHAAVGVEWLSAGIDRTRLTDSSPVAELSVRMAWQLGRVALWVSLDVRARMQTLSLDDPIDARLSRVATLISIGGVVLADPGSGTESR